MEREGERIEHLWRKFKKEKLRMLDQLGFEDIWCQQRQVKQ